MNRSYSMPATRIGGSLKLIMLFALEIGFIFALHSLGSISSLTIDFSNLSVWLDATAPEVALIASIRILALVFSYWLLATSVFYMIARAFRIPLLLRATELTTIPGVRRLIDAGLAATIIGGTVFGGAGAVFARSHDASKTMAPVAIESTYKDTRLLYNPTPVDVADSSTTTTYVNNDAGKTVTAPDEVAPEDSSPPVTAAVKATSETGPKAVSADREDTKVKAATTDTPRRDEDGNFIPTPIGETSVPDTDNTQSTNLPSTSTTQPKVISPDTTTPTTTVPKTTAPPTTNPDVQVGGKQVVNPNESTPANTSTHTVVAGDNFWKIARTEVERSLGRNASNAEVANYWVKLIDANRSVIRSGDPNLIFPGEVFTLPAI